MIAHLLFVEILLPVSQGSSSLPIGTILPYVGALADIPHGWALCDGRNGTPNLHDRFLQGSNVPKQFIAAGLPNITGSFPANDSEYAGYCSGGFYYISGGGLSGWQDDGGVGGVLGFNAAFSNALYGASTTVQPASYTVYYIMRIK